MRAVFLGETTLVRRCIVHAKSMNWEACVLASNDQSNRSWAESEGIQSVPLDSHLADYLTGVSFDYLFSVVNPLVLKPNVLALASVGTINFHDSLLPRFAGTHATSWAIIHSETEHGISWHEVTDEIDAGRIYVQIPVPISKTVTAYELNTACYEAAALGFERLLEKISEGKLDGTQQPIEKRSYFGKFEGPPNAGILRWTSSAAELNALIRATDFGPTENTFGSSIVALPTAVLCAVSSEVLDVCSASPGTVVGCDGGLTVATATSDIRITKLRTFEGLTVPFRELYTRYGLVEGARLPIYSEDQAKACGDLHNRSLRAEAFWIRRLRDLELPKYFFVKNSRDESRGAHRIVETLPRQKSSTPYEVAAAIGVFLRRIVRMDSFDIALYREIDGVAKSFTLNIVPCRLQMSLDQPLIEVVSKAASEFEGASRRAPILRSSFVRYFGARANDSLTSIQSIPIVLAVGDSSNSSVEVDTIVEQLGLDAFALLVRISFDSETTLVWNTSRVREVDRQRCSELLRGYFERFESFSSRPVGSIELETNRSFSQACCDEVFKTKKALFLERFRCSVEQFSEKVAVNFEGSSFTYRELDRESSWIAHNLLAQGVGKGERIGVYLKRSHKVIAAIVAVLKTGASYVPIDSDSSPERTKSILEDCSPLLVLTDASTTRSIEGFGFKALRVEEIGSETFESDTLQSLPQSPGDEAYLLYTSGSTGKPKGVRVSHLNLSTFNESVYHIFGNTHREPMLAQLSLSFDASIAEILSPLSWGGSITMVSRELVTDTLRFKEHVEQNRYNFIVSVPSQIRALLDAGWNGMGFDGINIGGEPLGVELTQKLFAIKPPGVRVTNMYGPTETTVGIAYYEIETPGAFMDVADSEPIGYALSGAKMLIVDEQLQEVPAGVPGEILLGGEFVALGYHNRPELTAERFIVHAKIGRAYRSGDLGRRLPDGKIEFIGRLDEQVKVRGVRIELGEIRAALASHPMIRDCAVCAFENVATNKEILAYYVGTVPQQDVKKFLSAKVSQAVLPAAVIQVDHIPLTPSGKIARNLLPKPSLRMSDRPFVLARSVTEYEVASLFGEILNLDSVSAVDDFFELGGNSLLAVSLVASLAETFFVQVGLASLTAHSTVEALANFIDSKEERSGWTPFVPLSKRSSNDQSAIFFIHPFGGTVFCYSDVARDLSRAKNVIGIQAIGAEPGQEAFADVSEMARYYRSEIARAGYKSVAVGGYSFGGLVAFEMVRQYEEELKAEVSEVPHLIILDTPSPRKPSTSTEAKDEIAFLVDLFSPFLPLDVADIRLRGDRTAQFEYVLARLRESSITPPGFTLERARNFLRLYQAHERAWETFRPNPLRSRIHLIRSGEVEHARFAEFRGDDLLGWKAFTSDDVELHPVREANHQTVLSADYAPRVAEIIENVIFQPRRQDSGGGIRSLASKSN